MSGKMLLELRNVTKIFKLGGIFFGSKLTAVDNVSFILEKNRNKVLSLVGESGSGKTTLGRIILGLIEPTKGQVLYKSRDPFRLNEKEKELFKKEVQPIFQNPYEAFNPLRKVDAYLMATTLNYGIAKDTNEAHSIIEDALDFVGLSSNEVLGKYQYEFSGGELQRVSIARALITRPQLLVADEPVSMVDASLRMSILNIFLRLKEKTDMSILYITHDLSTAYYVSDKIIVMYRGNIMEFGNVERVLTDPLNPYTKTLVQSLPEPDPDKLWSDDIKLSGLEVKEFEAAGCKFADRCPEATDVCFKDRPPDIIIGDRMVKCWLYEAKK